MNFSACKLLLIDDDTIVRESIAAYLDDSGFNVVEAQDGQEGYSLFKEENPDLIICDLRMPKLDGLALLKKISQIQQEIPTPIIVISGAGSMSDVVEALRLGASDYLVKPIIDMKVLEYSIKKSLERTELLRQNKQYERELEEVNQGLKESLELLEQDQRAGRQLQLSMLPQEPLLLGSYKVSYELIPSLYLSGDFVEYIHLSDDRIGFFIADVSGHGSSSAFVTALLHHLSVKINRIYKENDGLVEKPSEAMAYFNQELLTVGIDKYVTMFLGMIDIQKDELNYSVAGHLPMPILASEENVDYLEGTGMPLGIVDDVEYYDYSVALPDEFSLCLFSDGVLEVLSEEGLLKQEDRLLKVVKDGNRTLAKMLSALGLDNESRENKNIPDDIAILMIEKYGN